MSFDLDYEDADPLGLAGTAISSSFLVHSENKVKSFSGVVLRRYNVHYGLYTVRYTDGDEEDLSPETIKERRAVTQRVRKRPGAAPVATNYSGSHAECDARAQGPCPLLRPSRGAGVQELSDAQRGDAGPGAPPAKRQAVPAAAPVSSGRLLGGGTPGGGKSPDVPVDLKELEGEKDPFVVVEVMRAHVGNRAVMEAACKTLAVISLDAVEGTLDAGVLAVVVPAMRVHRGSEVVQDYGCRVVGNLSDDFASQALAVGEGAAEAVVAASRAHGGSQSVQESALWALEILTSYDEPANQARAGGAGAVVAVVAAMRAHEGNEALQESGVAALLNMLSLQAPHIIDRFDAGAVDVLAAAMRSRGGGRAVQKALGLGRKHTSAAVKDVGRRVLAALQSQEADG